YVLEGEIEHKDSLGTGATLRPGEVQRMTAGSGVRHSEFNPSKQNPLHFLQIWLLPSRNGLAPGYEQKEFPTPDRKDKLQLLASPDGRNGSLTVHQDVAVYGTFLSPGVKLELPLAPARHAWVQVARGAVEVNGTWLATGDGAALSGERAVRL